MADSVYDAIQKDYIKKASVGSKKRRLLKRSDILAKMLLKMSLKPRIVNMEMLWCDR